MPSPIIKASLAVLMVFAAFVLLLDSEELPSFRACSCTVTGAEEKIAPPDASAPDLSTNSPLDSPGSNTDQTNAKAETKSVAKINNNNGNASISLIVIASGQRSSSTFLSHQVLGNMSCHLSLNEILNTGAGQAGDAWAKEGKELLSSYTDRSVEPADLATFILRVGQRRCQELLKRKKRVKSCGNHCWVNYKHFSIHMDRDWKHALLWNSLIDQLDAAAATDQKSTFAMTILERDMEERWRSSWFAKETGDWNTQGHAKHKERLEAAEIPAVSKKFKAEHQEWFQMVRSYIKSLNGQQQQRFSVLDFSFDDVTTRPANATRAVVKKQIMKFSSNN